MGAEAVLEVQAKGTYSNRSRGRLVVLEERNGVDCRIWCSIVRAGQQCV